MKTRVLFVDDEPRVLDGLRDALRRYRHEWDMAFVTSGEEAIARLGAERFDVVVSDMRMPGMDGAQLLRRVLREHPEAVRIVLSGHTEHAVARSIVHIAHQFLAKPCEPQALHDVVERTCRLHGLLADERLRTLIGRIGQLPALSRVYEALRGKLEDPSASARDVAGVVEQDPAMCAKVLQVVNSAFFGLPRRIAKIDHAVAYLGTEMVKSVVLSLELFGGFAGRAGKGGFSADRMQRHGTLVARVARRLLGRGPDGDDAFLGGMLHDVGKLILAVETPAELTRLVDRAANERRPLHEVENDVWGVGHAELGAYLLGLWGLPYPVVEAVAHHHHPSRAETDAPRLGPVGAVHLADVFVSAATGPLGASLVPAPVDGAWIASLGTAADLDAWRALAAQEIGRSEEAR